MKENWQSWLKDYHDLDESHQLFLFFLLIKTLKEHLENLYQNVYPSYHHDLRAFSYNHVLTLQDF